MLKKNYKWNISFFSFSLPLNSHTFSTELFWRRKKKMPTNSWFLVCGSNLWRKTNVINFLWHKRYSNELNSIRNLHITSNIWSMKWSCKMNSHLCVLSSYFCVASIHCMYIFLSIIYINRHTCERELLRTNKWMKFSFSFIRSCISDSMNIPWSLLFLFICLLVFHT